MSMTSNYPGGGIAIFGAIMEGAGPPTPRIGPPATGAMKGND